MGATRRRWCACATAAMAVVLVGGIAAPTARVRTQAHTGLTLPAFGDSRFKVLTESEMLDVQRTVVHQWLSGQHEPVGRSLNVLLRSPEIAGIIESLNRHVLYQGGMTDRQREMVILMTARAWTTQDTWAAHAPLARRAGLGQPIIHALAGGEKPTGMRGADEVIWRIANELLYHRRISDQTFADGMRRLGASRLVNVTLLVPYYEMLCMLSNLDATDASSSTRAELAPRTVVTTPLATDALGPIPKFTPLAEGEGPASGEFKIEGGRFRPLRWSEMTPDQKRLADYLLASWRKTVSSTFVTLIRSPNIAMPMAELGTALNPRSNLLDPRVRNLSSLMAAQNWGAEFEYWAAHRNVIRAGMTEEQFNAVRDGRRPADLDAPVAAAFDLCEEMLRDRRVSNATFEAAVRALGEGGVVNVIIVVGQYGMVAAQTEALDRYPLPEGIVSELPASSP